MRAVVFSEFGAVPEVRAVPDPEPAPDGVVVAVAATGVCRSDWHAWRGHDPDVALPHVPGHELAGRIVEVGSRVRGWQPGMRVTVPFVCACGACPQCATGNQQICDNQFQPGFTGWGSFAEFVALDHAEVNLVALPEGFEPAEVAALGCRFGTAYRAVLRQGGLRAGEFVAVHGCGGAGLSAVLIAVAAGARVIAVDPSPEARELAKRMGAELAIDGEDAADVIRTFTGGGAHLSLDCAGLPVTCANSVASLRKRGRHVQVGLLPPELGVPPIPMHRVIADELRILGSHGLQAHEYPGMLDFVARAGIDLGQLISRRIGLGEAPAALSEMDEPVPARAGVTIVEPG
ncbi:zinc-dependent alcohol dehydrogenase family protein [Amycolatopsis acidicola]|uniref:Zinc-dependent alcohol dehydrogenase family protein n=1 Tax=Amycolatopsis acidicola TaxID=2596893 RepID=A0A5N0UST4_9PSEU|nr:zinc-dependent alcohol dehydrogenase family protein [Amycolatopsis acidicola]KAA9154178.1 zinc-dependent alcohol dehydrogenase family protein [Amycolatopsis acidicola]